MARSPLVYWSRPPTMFSRVVDILLADEPTGALDSETSVQVMDLLAEIAQEKLVIMVTHNPELAEKYANRTIRLPPLPVGPHEGGEHIRHIGALGLDGDGIAGTIRLLDGSVVDDTAPYDGAQETPVQAGTGLKKPSMSFFTAFALSLNNLLTKKGRTLLTSVSAFIMELSMSNMTVEE